MSEIKIGQVIKRMLEEKRRSLKEVSRETGVPYSTLHTWHENRQPKDIQKARRLAQYFGISLHMLLFDVEDQNEEAQSNQSYGSERDGLFVGSFEIIVRRIK